MLNFEVSTCSRFNAIISLTRDDRDYLRSFIKKQKYFTLPIGVDTNYFQPAQGAPEPASLVFVGNFKHYPNVDAALYFCDLILPLVQKKLSDIRLYLVGAESPKEVLSLSNRKNIIVTGRVKDVREYYDRATVVVVPVRLGGGMRGKIAEAWAMKKAVVTTSVGVEGYNATHNSELLIADEPKVFADCIINLIEDHQLRSRIEQNCFHKVQEKYSWDKIALQYENCYFEIIGHINKQK